METVHAKLLDLKRVLRGILRDEVDDVVRFAKTLPRDEINLEAEAETTLKRLREMEDLDARFDPAKWIGPLERGHEALVEAGDQDVLAGKEIESLQAMRRQALREFGQSFVQGHHPFPVEQGSGGRIILGAYSSFRVACSAIVSARG